LTTPPCSGADGSGGVDVTRGSGLSGLVDRVSALGGTLEIETPRGTGTTIRARIPLTAPGKPSRETGYGKIGPRTEQTFSHDGGQEPEPVVACQASRVRAFDIPACN
jgi:hypothetical protein